MQSFVFSCVAQNFADSFAKHRTETVVFERGVTDRVYRLVAEADCVKNVFFMFKPSASVKSVLNDKNIIIMKKI